LTSNKEVTFSASACGSSSERFKHDITNLSASTSLGEILALQPVSFVYNENLGSGTSTHVGFIAEEVLKIDPRLVTFEADGVTPHGLEYDKFTALLAGAVQDIVSLGDTFKTNLIAWLGSASNGITDLFAKIGHFNEADVGKLCVGSTCVTEDQFKAMLSASAAASVPQVGTNETPSGSSAPVLAGTDTATTTTSSVVNPITSAASSTPELSPPANDNPQPQRAEQSSHDGNQPASSMTEAANDNSPIAPMAGTGTDASPTTH
jgi:hypothetical protein